MQAKYMDRVMAIERDSFLDPWPVSAFAAELEHKWSVFRVIGTTDWTSAMQDLEGFVVCWMLSEEMHVLSLAVDKHHRRQGLARNLLSHVIELFGTKGGGTASLEVRESNKIAQAFYFSMGFEIVGKRPNYYRHGDETALIMNRKIEPSGRQPFFRLKASGR